MCTLGLFSSLETPSITESGVVCVQLYYHMYGSDMGSLKLYKGVQERENLIAERTGNQANKWEKLEVETRLDKNEKVIHLSHYMWYKPQLNDARM